MELPIGTQWRLIKKLFPRRHKKTIEKKLVELWETGEYQFASHRVGELYNYRLQIPNGDYMQVGFIRKKIYIEYKEGGCRDGKRARISK